MYIYIIYKYVIFIYFPYQFSNTILVRADKPRHGGVGSSGGGDGGGVGVGDLKRSVSSTGSGDGLSLKASCS